MYSSCGRVRRSQQWWNGAGILHPPFLHPKSARMWDRFDLEPPSAILAPSFRGRAMPLPEHSACKTREKWCVTRRRQSQLTATSKVGATVSHLTSKISIVMSTGAGNSCLSSEGDGHALTRSTRARSRPLRLTVPTLSTNRSCAAAGLHQFARLAIST